MKNQITLFETILFYVAALGAVFTIFFFVYTAYAQEAPAEEIPLENASSTEVILDFQNVEKVKTDFEVLAEEKEKLAKRDILLSKYAQELDRLRIRCGY